LRGSRRKCCDFGIPYFNSKVINEELNIDFGQSEIKNEQNSNT
jgi:hypothetical protein